MLLISNSKGETRQRYIIIILLRKPMAQVAPQATAYVTIQQPLASGNPFQREGTEWHAELCSCCDDTKECKTSVLFRIEFIQGMFHRLYGIFLLVLFSWFTRRFNQ